MTNQRAALLVALLPAWAAACAPPAPAADTAPATSAGSPQRVAVAGGLAGPEAVRYDPEQDVYFVSNFNGPPAGDANGFISRVSPDGQVLAREFMRGTAASPLHGPRGMALVGDTLWAADADGLHGFHRRTGAHLAFRDFRALEPGFLNDVTVGPDGALYVTDTGRSRLYRLAGGTPAVAMGDSAQLASPNGVTWDAAGGRFLAVSWGPRTALRSWAPGEGTPRTLATLPGGNFDGIEVVRGRILVASQADSSLHVVENGAARPLIRLPGAPADIGVDTRRNRVAVPYVARDEVEIWTLPQW